MSGSIPPRLRPVPEWVEQQSLIQINTIVSDKCGDIWTIYIETMGPPLKNAAIALLGFGAGDVLRGMLRPKKGRGSSHTRRKNKKRPDPRKRRRGIGIPEIGNMIGDKVGRAVGIPPIGQDPAGRYLWAIDAKLQQGLLYWLLFDTTFDFFNDYTSNIMDAKEENCSDEGKLITFAGFKQYHIGPAYRPIRMQEVRVKRGRVDWNERVAQLGAGKWFVCFSCTAESYDGNGSDITLGINRLDGTGGTIDDTEGAFLPSGSPRSIVLRGYVRGPEAIEVGVYSARGRIVLRDCLFICVGLTPAKREILGIS